MICRGVKRYEFRKRVFNRDVKKVYIYATSPIKKIVGYFTIERVIKDTPENLWKKM